MNEVNNLTTTPSQRESFVFYRSFKEAIDNAPKSIKLTLYDAIIDYALYREEPNLDGIAKIAWVLIKPQLDANWIRYEKGCKGGAPKGNQNARKNNLKQPETT